MSVRFLNLRSKQGGVGLIEVLIGMVMGLLMMLVIYQVYGVNEGQKRTITAGSDAQGNASYGMFMLSRELSMAGNGISSAVAKATKYGVPIDNCDLTEFRANPVLIEAGATAKDPDRITVFYGGSAAHSTSLALLNNATVNSSSATAYQVGAPVGFNANDLILAVQGANCTLSTVNVGGVTVSDVTGIATITHTPVPSKSTTLPVTYQAVNGALLNLGPAAAIGRVVYSVDAATSTLRSQNLLPTAAEAIPVVADVVNLKAQFGLDTDADGAIDLWQEATGDWSLANQEAARWDKLSQIRAVRIAVVTRSAQFERDPVTTDPLSMFDGAISMNLDAGQQHYRYKVLETIVPMRNQVWNDK